MALLNAFEASDARARSEGQLNIPGRSVSRYKLSYRSGNHSLSMRVEQAAVGAGRPGRIWVEGLLLHRLPDVCLITALASIHQYIQRSGLSMDLVKTTSSNTSHSRP